jgi:UPF0755 protein
LKTFAKNKIRIKIAVFAFLSLSLGFYLLLYYWSGRPVGTLDSKEVLFDVKKGQGLFQISRNLREQGLIANPYLFQAYVFLKGQRAELRAGSYLLKPSMSPRAIARLICSGQVFSFKLIIPEGFNLKQIEKTISAEKSFNRPDFKISGFKIGEFKKTYKFLSSAPDKASLEGYLFPDTYQIGLDDSNKKIAAKMLANFNKKLDLHLRGEIKKSGRSVFDIVRMASLLEREARSFEDKRLISGILWKRLESKMPLQVDATIVYITGRRDGRVTKAQTRIDSPYNTYRYPGLPAGPICNPGLESLKAAIRPQSSPFWYYLSTPTGKIIFSRSLEEHNFNKAKYLR